jgi:hypothetical protein
MTKLVPAINVLVPVNYCKLTCDICILTCYKHIHKCLLVSYTVANKKLWIGLYVQGVAMKFPE